MLAETTFVTLPSGVGLGIGEPVEGHGGLRRAHQVRVVRKPDFTSPALSAMAYGGARVTRACPVSLGSAVPTQTCVVEEFWGGGPQITLIDFRWVDRLPLAKSVGPPQES